MLQQIFIIITLLLPFGFITPVFSYKKEEKVRAYRCDRDNKPITSTIELSKESLELELGLPVRICFEATDNSLYNNLFIVKIDDFEFSKRRTPEDLAAVEIHKQIPEIIRQRVVEHGTAISDHSASILCNPFSKKCAIETTLSAYLFLSEGTIRGEGSILMQHAKYDIDKNGNRQLRHTDIFEDVVIDLHYIGRKDTYGKLKMRNIIIIICSTLPILILCGCWFFCFLLGFLYDDEEDINKNKKQVYANDDVEAAISKLDDDDDMSETHSLDEDSYWGDIIPDDDTLTNISLEEGTSKLSQDVKIEQNDSDHSNIQKKKKKVTKKSSS